MEIKNDTKEDLEIYLGNPTDEEPEITADLKSGEKKELPVEKFGLMVIKEEKLEKEMERQDDEEIRNKIAEDEAIEKEAEEDVENKEKEIEAR